MPVVKSTRSQKTYRDVPTLAGGTAVVTAIGCTDVVGADAKWAARCVEVGYRAKHFAPITGEQRLVSPGPDRSVGKDREINAVSFVYGAYSDMPSFFEPTKICCIAPRPAMVVTVCTSRR